MQGDEGQFLFSTKAPQMVACLPELPTECSLSLRRTAQNQMLVIYYKYENKFPSAFTLLKSVIFLISLVSGHKRDLSMCWKCVSCAGFFMMKPYGSSV